MFRSGIDCSGLGGIWDGPLHSGNVYYGQTNQYFKSFLGEIDSVLQTKDEKDHTDCYQQQVQKPESVVVWGRVGALGKDNLMMAVLMQNSTFRF